MTKKDKEWGRKNKDKKETLTDRLRQKRPTNTAPHVIVIARAGTGKTTTLVEGLKVLRGNISDFIPSPQQAAIWDAIVRSDKDCSACFVAFNKPIAVELERRVPEGCDAMTMHKLGRRAVAAAFGRIELNQYRVRDILEELMGCSPYHSARRHRPEMIAAVEKLVGLCKLNLVCFGNWPEDRGQWDLTELASHYDVDLNGDASEVFALVPQALERCKDVERDHCVDFNDMIWLPVVLNLSVRRYDLLLVDEAQDLNRCQQALALKAGRRLILCGDPKQAIYGFAGADGQSMERMEETLSRVSPDANTDIIGEVDGRGCIVLPLTVTRRCGRAIVREAQKYVPDFEAHESCGEGSVQRQRIENPPELKGLSYRESVRNGDMVLCRCNAPLVSECFRFLRAGRKATIQGRDVGQGLISTIRKLMKAKEPIERDDSVPEIAYLIRRLDGWLWKEQHREQYKAHPSDAKLIALQDRHDCIAAFAEDETCVDDVISKITSVFSDDKGEGIKLSSVHKAKGLEADRVFILQPKEAPMPHPMAKSAWEIEQEYNLLYVAITRARNELVYVT